MTDASTTPSIADLRAATAHLNAWVDHPPHEVPSGDGPLDGLTLAVKDIYAVAGLPSGWGQPTRRREARPEPETAPAVQRLLDAGARFVGLAQCDELCFSLQGINRHYGAPLNPAAPERVSGGSSSGSASLVAAGAVDIATGSDTGGSVRAPASHCGLIGLRTTHGRVPLERTMPLAHTLDVFGWFARDAANHARVADVVLGEDETDAPLTRLLRIEALDALVAGEAEARAYAAARERIRARFDAAEVAPFHRSPDDWYWAFREIQGFEAWANQGGFITRARPDLAPDVRARFEFGRDVTQERYEARTVERHAMIAWAEDLLGDDGCLVLPTMPSCAPLKDAGHEGLEAFRERALRLLCVSGLTGLPQITLPLGEVNGAPFGMSLLGPRGSDRALVELAERVMN